MRGVYRCPRAPRCVYACCALITRRYAATRRQRRPPAMPRDVAQDATRRMFDARRKARCNAKRKR